MKYLFGILLCISAILTFAQPENAIVKTIEGKKYYVHTVEAGNTLYGVHKLYNTDLDLILNANPGLTDNLQIGQQIYIPIDPKNAVHQTTHIVAEGETLYGISRKYNISVSDLKNANPGVEDGISIGQEIKIPQVENVGEIIQDDPVQTKEFDISLSDSIVMHTVLEHETLYSISKRYMVSSDTIMALNDLKNTKVKKGSILKIPVKKVNYAILEKEIITIHKDSVLVTEAGVKKGTYKIALFLPFMLAQNDVEMNKNLYVSQVREMHPITKIAFEFYQGFEVAVDSLRKAGMNLEIFVYDTQRDTTTIGKILNRPELKDVDLVIGPLYPNTISYTVEQCAKRKIRIVLPFKSDASVLHDNPYVFKSVTSNMTLMDGSIDYIVNHHAHHNVIILKPFSEEDKALYERAKLRFNESIRLVESYNEQIVELGLGSSGGRDLNIDIRKDTTNVVIVPSNDVKFITSALNRLNKVINLNPYAKNLKIIVFGFEDWNKYDDIDALHRNRLNQHYATYRFVDYNDGMGLDFVKTFRACTGVDPTVYSTQGFDIGMYFLSALYMNGTNFENNIGNHRMKLVQNDFDFKIITGGSGYENVSVTIVRYDNFELIECPD